MQTSSELNLEELYWEFSQQASEAEREAFLQEQDRQRPQLAAELRELLSQEAAADKVFGRLDERPESFAPTIVPDEASDAETSRESPEAGKSGSGMLSPGSSVGPYKLLEPIGEGGMGVVYLAQQSKPVRRKVALKIIKPGMDSKQVIARFEAERQALAMMEHPNIARALDAGTTETGLPYFVMELVRGIPMADYCDRARMPNNERLKLFCDACNAIQHAHNKGIIHRDIKPSNVLITEHDGTPVVKVIDFGVAKALTDNLTDKTLFTGMFQMIGTPLYMSPEQASLSNLDVDVRSDVYSLGVMLYELMSGTLPIDLETVKDLTFEQLRKRICDTEPPRPSKRLSTLKNDRHTIAQHRGIDIRNLDRLVTSELDWIAMKAIEKDRNRRYQSAREFAEDIQRFLDGDAVEACPPTLWYKLRKYGRRNNKLIAAAGLIMVASIATAAVSTAFAFQANHARAEANDASNEAEKQKKNALAAKKLADERLEQNEANLRRALKSLKAVVEAVSSDEFGQLPVAKKIRETTFSQAMAFYEETAREQDDHPPARLHRAKALQAMSTIAEARGDWRLSAEYAKSEVAILERLVSEFPDRGDFRGALISALFQRLHNNDLLNAEKLPLSRRMLQLHLEDVQAGRAQIDSGSALLHIKVASQLPIDSEEAGSMLAKAKSICERIGDPIGPVFSFEAERLAAAGNLELAIEKYADAAALHYAGAKKAVREPTELAVSQMCYRNAAQTAQKLNSFNVAERYYKLAIEVGVEASRRFSEHFQTQIVFSNSVRGFAYMLDRPEYKTQANELISQIESRSDNLSMASRIQLAELHTSARSYEEAIENYRKIDPLCFFQRQRWAVSHYLLAQKTGQTEHYDLCIEQLRSAIQLDPHRTELLYRSRLAASSVAASCKYEPFKQKLLRFASDWFDDNRLENSERVHIAIAVWQLGDQDRFAEMRSEAFQDIESLDQDALKRIAKFPETVGNLTTAIKVYEEIDDLDAFMRKCRAEVHYRLAQQEGQTEHFDKCIEQMRLTFHEDPHHDSLLYWGKLSAQLVGQECKNSAFKKDLLNLAEEWIADPRAGQDDQETLICAIWDWGFASRSAELFAEHQDNLPPNASPQSKSFLWRKLAAFQETARTELLIETLQREIANSDRAVDVLGALPPSLFQKADKEFTEFVLASLKSLENQDDDTDAIRVRALVEVALEEFSSAAVSMQRFIEQDPDATGYHHYQAALLCLMANDRRGFEELRQVMWENYLNADDSEDTGWMFWTLSLSSLDETPFPKATELAKRLLKEKADDTTLQRYIATYLVRVGEAKLALPILQASVDTLDTATSPTYYQFFLSMAHAQLGESSKAEYWLQQGTESVDAQLAAEAVGDEAIAWNRKATLQILCEDAAEAAAKN